MMIEGSGSRVGSGFGSIPLTSGSESRRQKNTWIRWIRNTVPDAVQLGEHGVHHAQRVARLSARVFTRCRQALNLVGKR
jgi:hypothetical protein